MLFSLSQNSSYYVTVWIVMNPAACFQFHVFTFFFFLRMNSNLTWVHCAGTKITIHALFITVHALKNIKNRSHGTIHTFKKYFATVLSVFSFQFQQQQAQSKRTLYYRIRIVICSN